jgi:hypothetical protein
MESCALPFLFASWRQGESVIVDGGFCENLPVSELNLNASTAGVVVAVSFDRLPPEPPKCIKTFSLSLLDIAIAHSVRRAQDAVKNDGHIIELEPAVGTFDFDRAFSEDYRNTFDKLYDLTTNRIKEIVAAEQKSGIAIQSPNIQSNYWTDGNKHLMDTMCRMGLVYERIFRAKRFRYEKVIFEVWVDYWKNPALPCKLRVRTTFNPVETETIECTSIQLSEFDPTIEAITSLTVSDNHNNPVQMICVPMRIEDNPQSRSVVAFYNPPLKASDGPFTKTYVDRPHLTPNQLQDFVFMADRPDGPIGSVELVLHVPKNKPGVDLIQKSEIAVLGRKMTDIEIKPFDSDPADYYAVGWTGTNISLQPHEQFGANISFPT